MTKVNPAQGPDAAAVFRFRADPPTATMQRIKGMVTVRLKTLKLASCVIPSLCHTQGGLPTFFDVSQSFASNALQQDTMLHQLGNATVVMGDDTWLQLFPPSSGVLAAAHPYPSLVVRDLHTVDDGVWTVGDL